MSDFYATLISNTPGRNNTISDFTTYLPNRLQFNNDYEVALVSFSYQHSWLHFEYNDASFTITSSDGIRETYRVPPGHYDNNTIFINTLNNLLPVEKENGTRFKYLEKQNKAILIIEDGDSVVLNERLAGVLGFESRNYEAFVDESRITLLDGECHLKIKDTNNQILIIDIPASSYENYNSLAEAINNQLQLRNKNSSIPIFNYDESSNSVELTLPSGKLFIFDEQLADMMGFDSTQYAAVADLLFSSQKTPSSKYDLILDRDCVLRVGDFANHNEEENAEPDAITIPRGYYKDIFTLLEEINTQLRKLFFDKHPITRLDYRENLKKMVLIIEDNVYEVEFNSRLSDILGFVSKPYHLDNDINKEIIGEFVRPSLKSRHEGINAIDLNLTHHNLFIYSEDLVSSSLIGGAYYPLLGIIPTNEENFSQYVVHTFPEPAYFKVQSNQLSKIHISIKDDSGSHIKFLSGRTVLFLHFRQSKN